MSRTIVILTGAGISQESGIPTFRDANGLWAGVPLEEVATADALTRDRVRVNAFYNERRRVLADGSIQPNAAHRALAELEAKWPADVVVITQNIDDLHERAGTRVLLHMHGWLLKASCMKCSAVADWREDVLPESRCPTCGERGELRPHVVLFQEIPFELPFIEFAVKQAGLFVSIGTSGHVSPAAGLVQFARARDVHTVELNLQPSQTANEFDEHLYGAATTIVPAYVRRLLDRGDWRA